MKLKFLEHYLDKGSNPLDCNFAVRNKKDEMLGSVTYRKQWREWVWQQCSDIDMSIDCLKQITDKLKELNKLKGTKNAKIQIPSSRRS